MAPLARGSFSSILRRRRPEDHPLIVRERKIAEDIAEVLESLRKVRDAVYEQAFTVLFEDWTHGAPNTDDSEPSRDMRMRTSDGTSLHHFHGEGQSSQSS